MKIGSKIAKTVYETKLNQIFLNIYLYFYCFQVYMDPSLQNLCATDNKTLGEGKKDCEADLMSMQANVERSPVYHQDYMRQIPCDP